MPHIWTHLLFSEDVIDSVAKPFTNTKYEAYMKLGSQGPNPFFYYRFQPWLRKEPLHDVGVTLHEKNCGPLLMEFIKVAKNSSQEVKAFVSGFITHHILDRKTHPFIDYFSKQFNISHTEFEVILDTALMDKMSSLKTWKTPAHKEIYIGRKIDANIVDLLYTKINKIYPKLSGISKKNIQKTYRSMLFALKVSQDPYGIKKYFFSSFISQTSHQPINSELDYLNLNNATWQHPSTRESFTKSFIELYNEARMEGIDILTEVQRYWKSPSYSTQKIEEMIGDISYYTGGSTQLTLEQTHTNKHNEKNGFSYFF